MAKIYRTGGLDFIKMKTDRAKVHLEELDLIIQKFIHDDPYSITRKDDVKNLRHVVYLEVKPMPEVIGMLVGEFAYSLRSGLEQLAWQLALLNVKKPRTKTAFPIFRNPPVPPKTFGDTAKEAVRDILPAAIPVIESLQPYNRGSAFKDDPLFILNELCVIDKHMIVAVHSSSFNLTITGTPNFIRRDLYYGVEIHVPISACFTVQCKPDVPEIIFGEPIDAPAPNTGIEVRVAGLRAIHDFFRDDLIPRFAGFF